MERNMKFLSSFIYKCFDVIELELESHDEHIYIKHYYLNEKLQVIYHNNGIILASENSYKDITQDDLENEIIYWFLDRSLIRT